LREHTLGRRYLGFDLSGRKGKKELTSRQRKKRG